MTAYSAAPVFLLLSPQNEIDQIFRIGPNGSEYHATYFTPGEHKTVFNPYSNPSFNGYIEGSYHNYTLYWTPDYLAWTIDRETYRNITYRSSTNRPPWRPMSYRLIFRTENSSYPGPSQVRAEAQWRRLQSYSEH